MRIRGVQCPWGRGGGGGKFDMELPYMYIDENFKLLLGVTGSAVVSDLRSNRQGGCG